MTNVTMWMRKGDNGIAADLIPGSIADAVYPRPDRNMNQRDEFAVKRLEEERAQARKLREKFPDLQFDHRFSKREVSRYLASFGLKLVTRQYKSALDPENRWLARSFIDKYVTPCFIAKTFPAEVSNERCRELASLPQLYAFHWIELTGARIGYHSPYSVSAKGVFFQKWSDEQIQEAEGSDWQIEMLQDNQTAPDLIFPCTPAELTSFVQNAIGPHHFSLPDSFISILSAGGSRARLLPVPSLSESCKSKLSNKKSWTDDKLKELWRESILPGATHAGLANKYNVTRQRIGTLIANAKDKFSHTVPSSYGLSSQLKSANAHTVKRKRY